MEEFSTRRTLLTMGAVLAAGAATRVAAQDHTRLKVMSFPGLSNFPHYAADYKGLFTKHGLTVELLYTQFHSAARGTCARRPPNHPNGGGQFGCDG